MGVSSQHFCITVGAESQAQASLANGVEVGGVQVFLAEVNSVGARVNRGLPVVVDEEPSVSAVHRVDGGLHFARNGCGFF